MHRIMDRVSMFRSFLIWCGVLIIFDLFFLYVEVSFTIDRVFLTHLLFGFCFNWLLLAGVRKYSRNHCPLAANFGTRACRFAVGVWFCISESSCWGGYFVYFFLSDAVFLCYRDIFSVTKLTYSFQFVAGGAGSYAAFLRSLTWVEK
jgi:hypothetical protein